MSTSNSTPTIDQLNRFRSESTSLNQPETSIHLRDRNCNSDILQLSSDEPPKSKSMLDLATAHQEDIAAVGSNTHFRVPTAMTSKNEDIDGEEDGRVDSRLNEAAVIMMRNIEHDSEENESMRTHVPLDEFEMAKKRRKEKRVHFAGL